MHGASVASSRGSVDIGSVDLIKCIILLLVFSPALLSEECLLYFILMTTSVTHMPLVLARMCGKWCYILHIRGEAPILGLPVYFLLSDR